MKPLKCSLIILFFSSLLFSQPDTLISINNISYACYVSEIENGTITTFQNVGDYTKFSLKQLKSVYIENYGNVYSQNNGLTVDSDLLQKFLEKRENHLEQGLAKESVKENIVIDLQNDPLLIAAEKNKPKQNKFYFGVFYTPQSSTKYYNYSTYWDLSSSRIYPDFYIIEEINSKFESHFGVKIKNQVFLQFNIAYNSSSLETYSKDQTIRTDPVYFQQNGYESKSSLDQLTLEIGTKHYITEIVENKVTPFFQLGIGKTFAWSSEDERNLFGGDGQSVYETNNLEEYLADQNSLFFFMLGGGAEYFFNNSFSVYSAVLLNYNYTNAEYESNREDFYSSTKQLQVRKTKSSKIETKVGVGLNFYF